jgi:hypothetical protein
MPESCREYFSPLGLNPHANICVFLLGTECAYPPVQQWIDALHPGAHFGIGSLSASRCASGLASPQRAW